MRTKSKLEERLLVLEGRLSVLPPTLRSEFEVADAKARALAAEHRLGQTLRHIRLASVTAAALGVFGVLAVSILG